MKLLDSPFREFTKCMDPDLPFCYNASNERFSTAVLPFFDEAPTDSGDHDPFRLHHLVQNRRDDSSEYLRQGSHFFQPETEHQQGNDLTVLMLDLHLFHMYSRFLYVTSRIPCYFLLSKIRFYHREGNH